MNAEVIADGIVLAVGRLSLGAFGVCVLWYVGSIVLDVWRDRRRARASRLAKRPAKAVSLESYLGMRGH